MKWLDKKVRFICNQLSDFIEKFSKDFDALHFVTQIIITSPIWITIIILIINASRGE
jgi:hypothetical protein